MNKGARTREAIVGAALAQISAGGLEALTIGTLARRVGLSKSGLYAHFASREALVLAALDEARDRFVRQVHAPALRAPRGAARLRALVEGWVAWDACEAHPGGCPFVAAAAGAARLGPVGQRLAAVERDWADALAEAARVAVEVGELRGDDEPADVAFELRGLLLAYHRHRHVIGEAEAEERLRAAVGRRLGARPAPRP